MQIFLEFSPGMSMLEPFLISPIYVEGLACKLRNLDPEWEEFFDLPIAAEPDNLEVGDNIHTEDAGAWNQEKLEEFFLGL